MILTTLLSFFGGNAFRMLWGEISAKWTAYQDHKYELQRMELQGRLDGERHSREQEAIKLQAELGVKTIRVQGDVDVARLDQQAWNNVVESTTKPSGIWIVDLWNGIIRPAGATMFLIMIAMHFAELKWKLDDAGWAMAGAFLGIYVADRSLFKRGK